MDVTTSGISPVPSNGSPACGEGDAAAEARVPDGQAGVETPRRPRLSMPARSLAAVAVPMLAVQAIAIVVLARIGTLPLETIALIGVSGFVGVVLGSLFAYRGGKRVANRLSQIAGVLQQVQDGDYRPRLAVPVADEIGLVAHRVNRLIGAAAAREKRLMESALADPLTGLYNRVLLTDRIRQAIASAQRTKAKFTVAVLDLNRFKAVNDTLGHGAGDRLLKEVARRLRDTVRESDTVARLGGDEFVLLLTGGTDAAVEISERLLKSMARPLRVGEHLIDIGVSVGIAAYPEHGEDDATLLRHADVAMYRAKHQRMGFCLFDGDARQLRPGYLSMLGEMRVALTQSQFTLDYQPQLDMKTGLIVGVEGLVRWNHPTRGRIPPNEFIPFAEQTGFMREITQWVVAEGARFTCALVRAGLDLRVSINVSAQDIENEGFCSKIGAILQEHKDAAGRLCLEITESGVVSETATAVRNLQALAAQGVLLSVDDFGTGYASLAQLQRLPVNELKIDRSFVTGVHQNHGNQSIVRATIDLAKQLGLTVVAEGVETVSELRTLAAMGCDEVQGYFVSKPMPADEVCTWVQTRHSLHSASRELYYEMLATH